MKKIENAFFQRSHCPLERKTITVEFTQEEHLLFPGKRSAQQMVLTFQALIVSGLETIILNWRGRKVDFLGMCPSNGDGFSSFKNISSVI